MKAILFLCLLTTALAARPPPSQRKFNSTAVEAYLAEIVPKLKDPDIARIFTACMPNTLDTTVQKASANDSFIITGDIDAMWLRDSTNQVLPYIRFLNSDPALRDMIRGVVLRQLRSVLLDEYANAFNIEPNGSGHQNDKRVPPMTPPVFEGKYEIDSLAAALRLTFLYWNMTQDVSILDDTFLSAVEKIISVVEVQMLSTTEQNGTYPYQFLRRSEGDKYPRAPAAHTNMVRSAFRPSDDQTQYDFLVPSSAMMATEMERLAILASTLPSGQRISAIREKASRLGKVIRAAVEANGTIAVSSGPQRRYVFEVDGFGNTNDMDDANVPSLLAMPYYGYCDVNSPTYVNTRAHVLSSQNPWFFEGTAAKGIGSPHTGPDNIWHMALIIQGITSTSDAEILQCLQYLKTTTAGTDFMHESFNKDEASQFTRSWFAWANTLFGEFIMTLADTRPHLIFSENEYYS